MSGTITDDVVTKVAKLAHITLPADKTVTYASQLEPILTHFQSLQQIETTGVEPTYQTTGLHSVLREDIIDTQRMFTQTQALSNASQQLNGYFVTAATIKK